MTDTKKLTQLIDAKGLKHGFIAKELGMSRQLFSSRLHGRTEFRTREIIALCKILDIPEPEREVIFFSA